ncbi:MAG: HDIG domain-containing protein [Candidatus Aerophobetes bacterium]|nr:HDIG domain-containing protein [Candidatus Aerophobetes bacterium]
MKGELLEIIPEFNLIEDLRLREKTLKVWEIALEAGGWEVKDLERMPFTLLIESCPCTMLEHIRGVTRVSIEAEKALKSIYKDKVKVNRDYLISGALLHDIGKLLEYREENGKFTQSRSGNLLRHPISGVGLCYSQGIPEEVMHIIASHSWEGDRSKRTPEAVIVHHADFINFEQFK